MTRKIKEEEKINDFVVIAVYILGFKVGCSVGSQEWFEHKGS